MGVPLLLSWLKRYVGDCFIVGVDAYIEGHQACDNLYIDLNSLLYQAAEAVRRSENAEEKGDEGGGRSGKAVTEETERSIIRQLFDILDDLVLTICRPRSLVYIAVDGVSPLGKMAEQRSRRLSQRRRGGGGGSGVGGFDGNSFTCGTAFMDKIALAVQYYCASRSVSINSKRTAAGNGSSSDLSFLVNDWTTPGEGEQKIFAAIRQFRSSASYSPNTRHCIVSNDTDVIICSLPLHEPFVTVLQYDHKIRREDMLFFSIELFRRFLYGRLGSPINLDDFERALHDIVFVLLLFGNDFLPKVSGVGDVPDGQLDRIVEFVASDLVTRSKTLVDPETSQINFSSVVFLLRHLVESNGGRPDSSSSGLQIIGMEGAMAWGFEDDPAGTPGNGEAQRRHQQRVKDRSVAYWTMLQWAVLYCCSARTPSWTASYPYDAGDVPSLQDLIEYCAVDDTRLKPAKDEPVSLYTQLLLLLPEGSASLLPPSLQHEYQRTFKPLLQSPAGASISLQTVEAVSREVARISARLTKEEALRQAACSSAAARLEEFAVVWSPSASAPSCVEDEVDASSTLVLPPVSAPKTGGTIFSRRVAAQVPVDLFAPVAVQAPAEPKKEDTVSLVATSPAEPAEKKAEEKTAWIRETYSGVVEALQPMATGPAARSRLLGVLLGNMFHVPTLSFLPPIRLSSKFGLAQCKLWTYVEEPSAAAVSASYRLLQGCTSTLVSAKRPREPEEEITTAGGGGGNEGQQQLDERKTLLRKRIEAMRAEALKQQIQTIMKGGQ